MEAVKAFFDAFVFLCYAVGILSWVAIILAPVYFWLSEYFRKKKKEKEESTETVDS